MDSNRSALMTGVVVGLLIGMVIGGALAPRVIWPAASWGRLGMPELFFVGVPMLFLAFWIGVIVVIVRAVGWMGRDRGYRLEDLPAYFEEWHQRAHAHMRETAAADDPDRRG